MKLKKLFSLLVSVLVLISSLGIFTVSAATVTKTFNVPVSTTAYPLPTGEMTADDGETKINVASWSATTADVSKVGYRLFTGTDSVSNTEVTLRVNAGAESALISESMEDYPIGNAPTATTGFSNYTLNDANTQLIAYENGESGNKVLKLTATNAWPSTNKGYAGLQYTSSYSNNYSISARVKAGMTGSSIYMMPTSSFGSSARTDAAGGVFAYWDYSDAQTYGDPLGVKYMQGTDVTGSYIKTGAAPSDGWFTVKVAFDVTAKTFDIYVNDMTTPVIADSPFYESNSAAQGLIFRGSVASDDAILIDDLAFSRVAYVTDDVTKKTATDSIPQNTTGEQTATVTLTMDDNTTSDFSVKYTPTSTATPGTYTTQGTIDGFSEPVPVSYTVVGIEDKTINTYVGATVTLDDGSTVTPAAMGQLKRTVTTDDAVYNYTINVGRYDSRLIDTMENHTETTVDVNGTNVPTINPVNSDGFKLVMSNTGTDATVSAQIATESDGNKYIKAPYKTSSDNATWQVVDAFKGDFRVTAKMKTDTTVDGRGSGVGAGLRILDEKGNSITKQIISRIYSGTQIGFGLMEGGQTTYVTDALTRCNLAVSSDDTTKSVDWFTVTIDVHANVDPTTGDIISGGTYDVLVNGVPLFEGEAFVSSEAVGNIGKVSFHNRGSSDGGVTGSIDDLTIYQYNCFTGDLQTEADKTTVLLGQGGSKTTTIPLTLSNGSIWSPNITVDVDTSKVGLTSNASATVEGFEDTITIDAKVCNYHFDAIGYKKGVEFVTAPVAGGTIATANVINKSGIPGGTALFVWYNESKEIKAVKTVSLPSASGTVDVGLALPEAEADVTNGMLKVFIVNDLTNLQPIDIVTEEAWKAQTAPKLFVAAASVYETNDDDYYFPRAGIGQMLGNYLSGVTVVNKAVSGSSTQTFIDNGYWDALVNEVQSGDYVLASFGHNDQVKCTGDTCVYGTNFEKFVTDVRAKGGNVIFASPIARLLEGFSNGNEETPGDTAYNAFNLKGDAVHNHLDQLAAVCKAYNVPLIDMARKSAAYLQDKYTSVTKEASDGETYGCNELYLNDVYWQQVDGDNAYEDSSKWAGCRYNIAVDPNYANDKAKTDNTHLTYYGAHVYADMLADAIAEEYSNIALTSFINVTAEPPAYPAY